jgi:NSS family neurotransmitter:Na+ symporter
MTNNIYGSRDSFTSKFGAISAAAGAAIGLGNIWRFPYVAGENGGAAFLFVYLICVLIIGLPIMMSEFIIGRSAQRNPYGAFKMLAPGKPWYLIGLMGVVAAFMILAFYSVVAGWTLEYIYQSFTGNLVGKSTAQLSLMFDNFRYESVRPVLWFLIFMSLTAWIVNSGVKNGIEKYTKILMPMLLFMLIAMAIYVMTFEGSSKGLKFLFHPDFSKITPNVILKALGQAFFSLSIGMGTLITYGSYLRKNDELGITAISVVAADTLIAVLAGIAIFPAIFAFADVKQFQLAEIISGEGLVFIALPNILIKIPGGQFLGAMFFLLLSVAAITSTISMLEVIVAYFSEELGLTRKKANLLATVSVSVLGIVSLIFSGVFGFLNFSTANVLLPLGGLFIVIFVGWFLSKNIVVKELSNESKLKAKYIPTFVFLIKYIAPIAIAIVFTYGIRNAILSMKTIPEALPDTESVIVQGENS